MLWTLADHQQTIRDLAEADGDLASHRQYDAFGNLAAESNPAATSLFGFTGREWDAEAGLYYYRARWYDPLSGRFVSTDPSGLDGGDANLYRYVNNNPVLFVDPSGLSLASPQPNGYASFNGPTAGAPQLLTDSIFGDLLTSSTSSSPSFTSSAYVPSSSSFRPVGGITSFASQVGLIGGVLAPEFVHANQEAYFDAENRRAARYPQLTRQFQQIDDRELFIGDTQRVVVGAKPTREETR